MKSISRHLFHYSVLIGILLVGFTGLVLFPYNHNLQVASATATVGAYIAWGIVHHYLHNNLYPETIVEYTAVGVLGLIILITLI